MTKIPTAFAENLGAPHKKNASNSTWHRVCFGYVAMRPRFALLLLLTRCIEHDPALSEAAAPFEAERGQQHAECTTDADCTGKGLACFPLDSGKGVCECLPGWIICDKTCVDPANDSDHCGDCGRSCASGVSCMEGACDDEVTLGSPSIEFVQMNPEAASSCLAASQAAPRRPATGTHSPSLWVNYQYNLAGPSGSNRLRTNYASPDPETWGTEAHDIPIATNCCIGVGGPACTCTAGYDPIATRNTAVGLDYAGGNAKTSLDGGKNCLGLAAFTDNGIMANSATHPLQCITSPTASDQNGDILMDNGSQTLWALRMGDKGQVELFVYDQCNGFPTEPECPLTGHANVTTDAPTAGTLGFNPCSHSGIVAYRDEGTTPPSVRLQFYNRKGTPGASYTVDPDHRRTAYNDGNMAHSCAPSSPMSTDGGHVPLCNWQASPPAQATSCDYNHSVKCARVEPRIQVVGHVNGQNQCHLYVTYDDSVTDSGRVYWKSFLHILPIDGNDQIGTPIVWQSSANTSRSNEFAGSVSVRMGSDDVAWGHYQQPQDGNQVKPCETSFVFHFDTGGGLSGGGGVPGWSGSGSSGNFPTIGFNMTHAITDNTRGVHDGLSAANTVALSFTQPVVSSSSGGDCVACDPYGSGTQLWVPVSNLVVVKTQ